MSKFMYSGSYTKKGVKGLLREGGTARRDETIRMVESLGGKVEAYYWCYGTTDFIAIMDFPDHTTVTGRTIFYFGVWMLGNFAWAFSYYLYQYKERNWNSIE